MNQIKNGILSSKRILKTKNGIKKQLSKIGIFFHNSLRFQKLKYYTKGFGSILILIFTLCAVGIGIFICVKYYTELEIILPSTLGFLAILIGYGIYLKQLQLRIFNNKKTLKEIKLTFSKRNLLFHLLKFELIFLFIDNLLTKNNRPHTALTKETNI